MQVQRGNQRHPWSQVGTNSLAVMRNFVKCNDAVTLKGAFAAYRELQAGELVAIPIAHPLFEAPKACVL